MKPIPILLVEDNPGDVRLVEEALRICAIPVSLTVAVDGENALALLSRKDVNPALIILDLNIPKLSGLAVLEQYQPKGYPPVVVFSSTWGQTDIRRALALGAREVVHKPMDLNAFVDAVCGIVRKWVLGGGQRAAANS